MSDTFSTPRPGGVHSSSRPYHTVGCPACGSPNIQTKNHAKKLGGSTWHLRWRNECIIECRQRRWYRRGHGLSSYCTYHAVNQCHRCRIGCLSWRCHGLRYWCSTRPSDRRDGAEQPPMSTLRPFLSIPVTLLLEVHHGPSRRTHGLRWPNALA